MTTTGGDTIDICDRAEPAPHELLQIIEKAHANAHALAIKVHVLAGGGVLDGS